jgi:capsular exopolysaccharide synthesis family protein
MEPIQYLKAIRGRWLIVVLLIAVGLSAAWLMRDVGAKTAEEEKREEYTASAVLLSSQSSRSPGFGNLKTLSALARLDEILRRVAVRIGYNGNPQDLKEKIQVTDDANAGFLTFTASGSNRGETEILANGFAKSMIRFVFEKQTKDLSEEIKNNEQKLADVRKEVDELNDQLAGASEEQTRKLRPLLDQKLREQGALDAELSRLKNSSDQLARIELIQPAVAKETATGGPTIPNDISTRLIIGGAAGLLLGLLIALLFEKVNTRIRNSESAERHFQAPVLARIPRISSRQRKRAPVAVVSAPSSGAADAFRVLAASIMRWPPLAAELAAEGATIRLAEDGGRSLRASEMTTKTMTRPMTGYENSPRPKRAVLITSSDRSEGKSTVVANLAGAFSELGKNTVVLSCDLRRPEVHTLLEVENSPGLVDGLRNNDLPVLNGRVLQSPLNASKIKVVPSGPPPQNPAELLNSDRMRRAIDEACRRADVVLIDTPPILSAMDVAAMISEVDAVLVVARSGKTTTKVAAATSETLNSLAAPFLGVVLNYSSDIVRGKSYGGFPPLSRQQRDS